MGTTARSLRGIKNGATAPPPLLLPPLRCSIARSSADPSEPTTLLSPPPLPLLFALPALEVENVRRGASNMAVAVAADSAAVAEAAGAVGAAGAAAAAAAASLIFLLKTLRKRRREGAVSKGPTLSRCGGRGRRRASLPRAWSPGTSRRCTSRRGTAGARWPTPCYSPGPIP